MLKLAYLKICPQLFDFLEALLYNHIRIDVINSVYKTERLSVGNAVGGKRARREKQEQVLKTNSERPCLASDPELQPTLISSWPETRIRLTCQENRTKKRERWVNVKFTLCTMFDWKNKNQFSNYVRS